MAKNLYPPRTEIDLRSEFNNTLYGRSPEIQKGQQGLLRVFRIENNLLVKCPCIDKVTGEPDRESRCPICFGEGRLFDESTIEFYKVRVGTETAQTQQDRLHSPGLINTETEVFYISSTYSLTKTDKIVVLALDKEGIPLTPIKRSYLFRIAELRPMRLDNGRLEFWKAYCYQDNNKFI